MARKLVCLTLFACACSSGVGGGPANETGTTIDMPAGIPNEAGSTADHKVTTTDGAAGTAATVASVRSSGTSGTSYSITNATVIIAQKTTTKWTGYIQDSGVANGIEVYCSSSGTSPCTVAAPGTGATIDIVGVFSPYKMVDQLIPKSVTALGAGKITYASVTSDKVAETATGTAYLGTPVHLSDAGPWLVTSTMPPSELNPKYAPMCTKGPQYFGVEVTDMANGAKLIVTGDWYSAVGFTTDAMCDSTKTLLTTSSKFSTLGGIVEINGNATPPVVVLEPFSPADYKLM